MVGEGLFLDPLTEALGSIAFEFAVGKTVCCGPGCGVGGCTLPGDIEGTVLRFSGSVEGKLVGAPSSSPSRFGETLGEEMLCRTLVAFVGRSAYGTFLVFEVSFDEGSVGPGVSLSDAVSLLLY